MDKSLDVYKQIVDFCVKHKINDYYTKYPLVSFVNRDVFLQLITYKDVEPYIFIIGATVNNQLSNNDEDDNDYITADQYMTTFWPCNRDNDCIPTNC